MLCEAGSIQGIRSSRQKDYRFDLDILGGQRFLDRTWYLNVRDSCSNVPGESCQPESTQV